MNISTPGQAEPTRPQRRGYGVGEEFPIFLAIFALPAVVALFAWWKFS